MNLPKWSKASINAVVEQGYPNKTFKADASITRAEAVVTLDNVIQGVSKEAVKTFDAAGTYGPTTFYLGQYRW